MSAPGYTPISLYYSTTAAAAPSAGNLANGELAVNITDGKLFYKDNGGVVRVLATAAGSAGDVVGPGSSTDNALVRFDGTTGKLVQNSAGVLDDSGNLTGLAAVTMSGALTLNGGVANGVAYLNGSKVLTSGSALTFDGTTLALKNTANLADNYNAVSFSSDFTPSSLVDTNESGRVDFYNKSNNGTQQLGTSIQASAVTSTSTPTVVYGKLKLHAYYSASGAIQDTSYLELFANSTSTLRGNAGVDVRAGSSANSGKSLCFYTDDGDSEAYRITSAGTSIWSVSGSEQMRLTSTGLGIGTSSPAYKLDVNGQARLGGSTGLVFGVGTAFAGGQAEVYSTSTTPMGLGTTGAAVLRIYTNSTLQATFDSSGNLGLGVTPSAWFATSRILQIGSGGAIESRTNFNPYISTTSNAYLDTAGTYRYIGSAEAGRYLQDSGTHKFYTAPSGTAGNAISFTQAMTLDVSGNLSLGATSSPYSASGRKVFAIDATTSTMLALQTSSTNRGYVYADNSTFAIEVENPLQLVLNTIGANPILFKTSNTERARIDSSGWMSIGRTSGGGRVNIQANTNNFMTEFFNQSGGSVGSIQTNGTTTSYVTSSDYRLKDNIAPMTGALATVAALKPCTYKWKADGSDGQGFIAHELQSVVPDCVTGEKDAVDAEGNPKYQGIDTSFLVATLTAAIQEQQAIITALTARVQALESN